MSFLLKAVVSCAKTPGIHQMKGIMSMKERTRDFVHKVFI
jgi:hypothetical protein